MPYCPQCNAPIDGSPAASKVMCVCGAIVSISPTNAGADAAVKSAGELPALQSPRQLEQTPPSRETETRTSAAGKGSGSFGLIGLWLIGLAILLGLITNAMARDALMRGSDAIDRVIFVNFASLGSLLAGGLFSLAGVVLDKDECKIRGSIGLLITFLVVAYILAIHS